MVLPFKVFSLLAKNHINVDIILQGIGHEEGKDICFTVASSDLEKGRGAPSGKPGGTPFQPSGDKFRDSKGFCGGRRHDQQPRRGGKAF